MEEGERVEVHSIAVIKSGAAAQISVRIRYIAVIRL
jgi:hypothetical protein